MTEMKEMDRELIESEEGRECTGTGKSSLFDADGMLIIPSGARDGVSAEVCRIIDSGEPFTLHGIRTAVRAKFGGSAVKQLSSLQKTVQEMLAGRRLELIGKDGVYKVYRRLSH